jgi:RNA polymerase sigma factor (sigma-70 family)
MRNQGKTRPPSFVELEHELTRLATAAAACAEQDNPDLERLVFILMRPALRIARAKLEDMVGPENVDRDDLDDIAQKSLISLSKAIRLYRQGAAVFPWFSTIVRNRARDFVRREFHTRSNGPRPEFVPLDRSAFLIPAASDDVDELLGIGEFASDLPPELQHVLELSLEGYRTGEIAELVAVPVRQVREWKKELCAEYGALQ